LETGHALPPEQWEADKAIAADALRFFNVKYIVVRPETPGYLNDPAATSPYIETILPVEKLHQSPELTLYRVNLPPLPNKVTLLQSPLTPLYFGEGWGLPGDQIIAQRKETRLLVPLNGKTQTLHLAAKLWNDAPKSPGKMRVELNGWQSEALTLNGEWRDLSLTLPAEAVNAGLNDIRFHFDALNTNIAPNPYPPITVISAGEEAGNLGHIYLAGKDVSPNRRGFNVAVIETDGNLISAAAFDTHADPAASRALAAFIAAAPDDALIAVAVKDEASAALTEEGVAALRSLGGRVDLRGQFRASYALLTAPNLPAQEAFSPFQPVTLTAKGPALTEVRAAAIFRIIQFSTQ